MEKQQFCFVLLTTLLLFVAFVNSKPSTWDSFPSSVDSGGNPKAWNLTRAFISYRRSFSKHLAMLIKVVLQRENISAFLDVENLRAGYWDDQIKAAIKQSPNFIIILSNGTLDRCIGDTNYTDVLHQEIKTAVDSKRNIIPVFDGYTHPKVEFSPEIQTMMRFQGLEWNHSLVNATIKRLVGYLVENVPPNNTSFKMPK